MNAIESLVEEYNNCVRLNQENTPLAIHLESLIESLGACSMIKKTEKTPYQTNSSELVTVPSFIYEEIKVILRAHEGQIPEKNNEKHNKALELFSIGDARETKKRYKGLKVLKTKKTKTTLSLEELRLSLKQLLRTNLSLMPNGEFQDKIHYLTSLKKDNVSQIKRNFMLNFSKLNEDVLNEVSPIREISCTKVSDGLKEAEKYNQRQNLVAAMIASLKEEDRLNAIEKNNGVRIAR